MLKQQAIDWEKNIVFGYCWKGTTGVKKEKYSIFKILLKELETTKNNWNIYLLDSLFFKEDLHRDCILDKVKNSF